jgi:hypothetical protein
MTAPREKHERTDATPRLAGLIAAGVALGLALALLAGWAIVSAGSRPMAARLGPAGLFAHGPDERTGIEEEWPKLEAETRQHLAGYGWVDRSAGVVRIPIERAMERMAAPGGTP